MVGGGASFFAAAAFRLPKFLGQENPTLSGEASCLSARVWHRLGLFPVLTLVRLGQLAT